ncbi:hypothetical protein GTQ99_22235, partial [Kineococcus sp. T13]
SAEAARAAALANRADALGLVALVHAGLLARWPAAEGVAPLGALPAAPAGGDGRPLPPKDVRADVPNDLDTLCAVTFGPHEDGPRDAAELALQLAPWSMDTWQDVLRRMRGELATAEVRGRLKNRDEVVPDAEPPVPFARPHSTGRPPREDSRLVLGILGVVVVVGLVLALWQLSRIDVPDVPTATPRTSSAAPSGSPATSPPASAAPAPAPAAEPAPLPVAAVTALDPAGDGESPESAGLVVDGDPATTWASQRYNSAAFGGLKDGVGLLLDLGADADVARVQLGAGGDGGTVELRTAPGPGVEGSVVVAAAAAGGQQVLAPPAAVRTRYLLLWFTSLPTTDGVFREVVGEVQVVGTPVGAPAGATPPAP